jgi:leader peptidase (prepilin peptidase) / N-methyltransferase
VHDRLTALPAPPLSLPMSLTELLASSPAFLLGACILAGLIVGSFLNVVIHRLPIMLERQWQEEEHCGEPGPEAAAGSRPAPPERYDLVAPRSACPACGAPITALQNIPLLSYLLLGGRCASCHARISLRYPLVEALTAAASGLLAWRFGFGLPLAAALLLTWFLIALTFIDLKEQLLPDELTYPLLWTGLLLSLWGTGSTSVPVEPRAAILGAVCGYLSLFSVYHLYRLLTGQEEALGYGDFKLLAALGAWLGWKMLLPIILFAAVTGAVGGFVLLRARGESLRTPIPFGPFLALAGFLALVLGEPFLARHMPFFVPYP